MFVLKRINLLIHGGKYPKLKPNPKYTLDSLTQRIEQLVSLKIIIIKKKKKNPTIYSN